MELRMFQKTQTDKTIIPTKWPLKYILLLSMNLNIYYEK